MNNEEIARYSRHLLLPQVGMEGQRRLKAASVLCIGAGGLGSPLTLYLAAAGVGKLGIVDFDRVDQSNLQRQVLHSTSWLGKSKVESARARLLDLNPNIEVVMHEEPVTSQNALQLIEPYDVIADGTDNFPTRYLVNDACVLLEKPNVYGSVFRFEGQASVFSHQGGPCYRCLYEEPPPPELVPSCAEGGVLGIVPGLIGVIQATEAMKIILEQGATLSGRLLLYDALDMEFRELRLRKNPDCAVCGDEPTVTELIDYHQFCGAAPQHHVELPAEQGEPTEGFSNLTVREIKDKLDAGWSPFILDVRKPHEADIVRINSDLLIPHEDLLARLDELPRDREILVHCKVGGRSAKAATTLVAADFDGVVNMLGGITAWAQQIDPTLPTY
ncbi:MAG: molybdenum cofactor biosynthesis protein MoeB [Deltaproteobacteria bacterium]|nr:molybdenum cofactor biosynthesis protein MoeB [Deltaproteobacteria bacterium]